MSTPRIEDVFTEALTWPPEDRGHRLDEACAGNAKLRAEIESLLEAHSRAGPFMAEPSVEPAPTELPGEGPGTTVGRYRLLQLIGEGGFGAVFMAEQREPVKRTVALKIIKLGMDTKQVIARFEAERQALAMMDHPSIARVLDAGATSGGRPYFVMELVRGEPITRFCDRTNLSISQRLELFGQVCQAVQHAHQKGIIHRDLKPSNVLVSEIDGHPTPKIIDFGIAKATGGHAQLTDKTIVTDFRQFIGTPEYMSPEQAGMGAVDIDTRSDIYSLGVLLYELLTGGPPFDPQQLRTAAWEEMRRVIREDDPERPSTRLNTQQDSRAEVAARRGAELARLIGLVRGDLDWIVMKSLEKDRARRYETANALATDIARHLSGEPVVAAPPSRMYRLRKFASRNRGPVAAGLTIALVLVLGTIGTSVGLMRALSAETVAELRADELADVVAFLDSQLADLDTVRLYSFSIEGKERSLTNLREVAEERERVLGPESPHTLFSMMMLGERLARQGNLLEAEQYLRRALDAARGVLADDDPLMIRILATNGSILLTLGRLDEAEAFGAEAVRSARILFSDQGHPDKFGSWGAFMRYGRTLTAMERFEQAEAVLLEAHAIRTLVLGTDIRHPGSPVLYLAQLYEAWHKAEPGQGYDAEAAQWRARYRGTATPTEPPAANDG